MSQPSGISTEPHDERPSADPETPWTGGHVKEPPRAAAADMRSLFGGLKSNLTIHWTVQDR